MRMLYAGSIYEIDGPAQFKEGHRITVKFTAQMHEGRFVAVEVEHEYYPRPPMRLERVEICAGSFPNNNLFQPAPPVPRPTLWQRIKQAVRKVVGR